MNESFARFLRESIAAASQKGQFCTGRELADAGSRHFSETLDEAEFSAALDALCAGDEGDIRELTGAQTRRFYDSRYMSRSYARALHLSEEGDDAATVADAVRTDSRVYPRPTPIETFEYHPYGFAAERIEATLALLSADTVDYADIVEIAASNGDRYLYSDRFLDGDQAGYMAEYESVISQEIQ